MTLESASEITESRKARRPVGARGTELAWGEAHWGETHCSFHLTSAGGATSPGKWRLLLPPWVLVFPASEVLCDHLSALCPSALHPSLAAAEP